MRMTIATVAGETSYSLASAAYVGSCVPGGYSPVRMRSARSSTIWSLDIGIFGTRRSTSLRNVVNIRTLRSLGSLDKLLEGCAGRRLGGLGRYAPSTCRHTEA